VELQRDPGGVEQTGGFARVEVEHHRRGLVQYIHGGQVRVELDGGQVGGPQEAGQIVDHGRVHVLA
jgi:hypothetical protein